MNHSSSESTRWILPATILGSSLGFIDSSVVNVALPAVQTGFHSSLAAVQWVVNGYMLTLASCILLGGAAGDRLGQRRVFLLGLYGFAGASTLCALAPSVAWLIGARLLQGLTAAFLTPTSLAIIGLAFSGAERARVIGTWAGAAALTTALGPPLGGWLVDTIGWRAVFFVNLPLAALAVVFALRTPPDRSRSGKQKLDLAGAVLAILTLGLCCYGLIELGKGRHLPGWSGVAAASIAGTGFYLAERHASAPMMPLRLFSSRAFAGVNCLTVLLYAALTGVLFLLPFVLIRSRGYDAAQAGTAFLPFALMMGLGSRTAGGLGARFGAGLPLAAGSWITAGGFVLLGLEARNSHYWTGVLPGLLVAATGMTTAVAPLTTAVFDSVPKDMTGVASGINNMAARAGGLLAVAALGLAFGGAGTAALTGEALITAYRTVMFVGALLAIASGVIAMSAIAGR
jgi:EmrB/QacA subfamily drug resistance transporter